MKDKYNSIKPLNGINLRIEILRRFFNLAKDYTILHEIFIASDDLLRNFVHEYKRLSRELRFRVRMKEFLIGLLFLIIFKAKTSWLPDSFFLFINRRYKFLLKLFNQINKVIIYDKKEN